MTTVTERQTDVTDEIVVDGLLTAAELAVRDRAREVVAAEVAPRAATLDREHTFANESYQALVAAGFGGPIFDEQLGGAGLSTLEYALVMEEITAGCGATSLVYMTQVHAAYPLLLGGSPDIVNRWVPALNRGETYGSLAITEPGAGSDASAMRTTARRDGEDYVLDGSKTFITTGDRADILVVFATTDRTGGRGGITAFAVPGDTPGVERGRPFHKMGMHGSTTAEVFFSGVRVPAGARLGTEGKGWDLVTKSVVKSRVSAAAEGVGLARGAYAQTLAVLGPVRRRVPTVAFRLAELRTAITQGRLLLHGVARAIDSRPDDPLTAEIGMMKLACTDLGLNVALAAAELLGPEGDLVQCGVERYVRDAKVTQIYDGTNEVQRLLIARDTHRRLTERQS
ncbi:MAG: acyl-CoA dehydrogenase family protein [Sporichthyaceae bacterium]